MDSRGSPVSLSQIVEGEYEYCVQYVLFQCKM